MAKDKLAVLKDIRLDEFILIVKYLLNQSNKFNHISGFVNIPFLCKKPSEQELERVINSAIKNGVLINSAGETEMNSVIATFVNAWMHSTNVVMIKKPSYSDTKGISVTKVENMYLVMIQDVLKNSISLLADSDFSILYHHIEKEIDKKDILKNFKLKNVNRALKKNGSAYELTVEPVSQLFLQCVHNQTGKKVEADTLVNLGKKQIECVRLNEKHVIESVDILPIEDKFQYIKDYIDAHCTIENREKKNSDETDAKDGIKDPEFYTRLSFMKLTRNEKFPKSIGGFFKMMVLNFVKSFVNWKNLLKRVGLVVLMSAITLFWNLYALCYLNDTFNLDRRAIFGNATAYLLAGVTDTRSTIGLPSFLGTVNTVTITVLLYYLLSIAIRTLIRDIVNKKVKSNISHISSFRSNLKNYVAAVHLSISYYIWIGLAVAAVLNIVLFNPFTVALLAVMLIFSCIKCEDGAIAPLLMIFASSTKYRKVVSGKKKIPLFADYQLRIYGIGLGLLVFSVINLILWKFVSFNFWVRLSISIAIIILTLLKFGIIKVNKPTAVAIFVLCVIAVQFVAIVSANSVVVLADDGGWTESGGTIAGLMNNYGWETVLGFSLTLALAVGIGCFTAGFGTAAILGAAGLTFGGAATAATFTETGRKTAYDFVWGNYSPYGGDSMIALGLNLAVSCAPVFGNIFGYVTGVRDCSYDIKEGDWAALCLDGFGFGLDAYGVAKEADKLFKHSDILADMGKQADEVVGEIVTKTDEVADEVVEEIVTKTDEVADEVVEEIVTKTDEVADEVVEEIVTKTDEVADEVVEEIVTKTDEVADEVVDETVTKADEVADEIADETVTKSDNTSSMKKEGDDECLVSTIREKNTAFAKEIRHEVVMISDIDIADAKITDAIRDIAQDANISDEVIDEFIAKLQYNKTWDEAKMQWGDGWNTLTDEEHQIAQGIVARELSTKGKVVESKLDGMDTLVEFINRADEGYYTKSLDEIMKLKLTGSANAWDYSSIVHGDLLPRADEFMSDKAIIDYIKSLCPEYPGITKCNSLQDIANELYEHPIELEFVSFQNASPSAANFKNFGGDYGAVAQSLTSGGGVYAVPVSKLSDYAENYPDFCELTEDGTFIIRDHVEFGKQVLSGVKLSEEGAYMIKTKVPFNGSNISMPSVNNWSAYLDKFVSGGKLLSGETEVTIKPLHDIIGSATTNTDYVLEGKIDGIEYIVEHTGGGKL